MRNKDTSLTFEEKVKYFNSPTLYLSTKYDGVAIKAYDENYVVFLYDIVNPNYKNIHKRKLINEDVFRYKNYIFHFDTDFFYMKFIHHFYLMEHAFKEE